MLGHPGKATDMKAIVTFFCIALLFCGCQSSPPRFNAKIPPGYYLVVGHVHKPGLIKCGARDKTLQALIDEAGGQTRTAFLDSIRVSSGDTTNFFSLSQNPELPCGSRVWVSTSLWVLF